jgi:hypothetical protein
MVLKRFFPICLLVPLLLAGAACDPKTANDAGEPATLRKSDAKAREKIAITVYNQNFGLVREVRRLDLADGRVELEFGDVSAHIQPETVALKALDDPDALAVLEQNYRYDLLTPEKLLEKYVGKTVKVTRWNEKLGRDETEEAEVLSDKNGVILKIGDEITAGYPGRISFPDVPPNLMAKPTLVWLLASTEARQRVEVTYLTQNLGWKADYVLVVDKADSVGDLHGWVTLSNETGTTYEDAELKLVAGDVQKIQPPADYGYDYAPGSPPMPAAQPQFSEEGLFEYHLYTLQRPTTLRDKEQKQVTLLDGHGVGVKKKLIFYGQQYYYRSQYGEVQSNQKVGVYLDIVNSKANHLGLPLPKGIVRVYKEDGSGARQFIGEDSIDHTPRDEKIRVKMGDAFDVVGDRKQMGWTPFGYCTSESRWEIELRNHKDSAEQVEVFEPIGGDWEVLESSHKHERKDANTFTFDVSVPANGKVKITYRVRVRWC